MSPALIVYRNGRYEAYNDSGRMITQRAEKLWLEVLLAELGYITVTPTSRLGRTIYDLVAERLDSPVRR